MKFKLYYNLTVITSTLREDLCTFMTISGSVLLRMRYVLENLVEEIDAHVLCSGTYSRKLWRLCDIAEECGTARQTTDDDIIQRVSITYC